MQIGLFDPACRKAFRRHDDPFGPSKHPHEICSRITGEQSRIESGKCLFDHGRAPADLVEQHGRKLSRGCDGPWVAVQKMPAGTRKNGPWTRRITWTEKPSPRF